jgi:hypothetical protein
MFTMPCNHQASCCSRASKGGPSHAALITNADGQQHELTGDLGSFGLWPLHGITIFEFRPIDTSACLDCPTVEASWFLSLVLWAARKHASRATATL